MLDFCIRGLFSTVKFIEAIRRNISGTQTRPRVSRVAPDAWMPLVRRVKVKSKMNRDKVKSHREYHAVITTTMTMRHATPRWSHVCVGSLQGVIHSDVLESPI